MLWTITALICSAAAFILSYPQTGWWLLAWVALVPFLFVIDGKSYKASFGWGFLYGFLFFAGTLGWFIYVTYPGAFLIIFYLSIYFALFGLAFRFFSPLPLAARLIAVPSVWTALEYARAHAFSGFGWAMLGHSQYQNLWLIQMADIAGVYGVSFLVMLVNMTIFERIKLARAPQSHGKEKQMFRLQAAVCGSVALALIYGWCQTAAKPVWPTISVGVVQPNIAQSIKWDPTVQPWIVQQTINLSRRFADHKVDLIVWPETSLPGAISEAPYLMDAIKIAARKLNTPVLIGAITDENDKYYNSAYLISAKGEVAARYDKIHLVPFGEYFPFRNLLSWIYKYIGLEDFTPGRAYTLFKADPSSDKPFGVLICFEDTLGYLWRDFVHAGAGFFVNMTNDAWFMDTKAPFIHLQAAVFGCVENKRSLVRAANTGFSGFIDPWGRVISQVEDEHHKKTFIAGTAMARIPVVTARTFYTNYGDVFTWGCFFVILWVSRRRIRLGRTNTQEKI